MASESIDSTRIMVAVNQSTLKGYPHASISSKGAFEWTLHKIIRSNTSGFKLLILQVQVPDEDGFDGVDSIYASPEDFKSLRQRDKNNGLQLLHYYVKQCHEIGVACEAWVKTGDAKDLICHEVKMSPARFASGWEQGSRSFSEIRLLKILPRIDSTTLICTELPVRLQELVLPRIVENPK